MCLSTASKVISSADFLWIGAGVGIGVDSGLPDFRGDRGFWKAYPPLQQAGLTFYDMANPQSFQDDASRAWGVYGHRLQLYRDTQPHVGFQILRSWCQAPGKRSFVFTSNVDGHFQAASFCEREIFECHGTIHRLQCSRPCSELTWENTENELEIETKTLRAVSPLPRCPKCHSIARPNILMFQDGDWVSRHAREQLDRYEQWLNQLAGHSLAVLEIGAGTAVPTVRMEAERLARLPGATLIRINPRDHDSPGDALSIRQPAVEALQHLDRCIRPTGSNKS
nr:Sir2 family NAD-dependent protein deacetylase [Planctomycetota bacterium]